jgi:hypothetical protein
LVETANVLTPVNVLAPRHARQGVSTAARLSAPSRARLYQVATRTVMAPATTRSVIALTPDVFLVSSLLVSATLGGEMVKRQPAEGG